MDALDALVSLMANVEKSRQRNAELNKDIIKAHINDADFGLCYEKPIFVKGITQTSRLLSCLRTANGKKLVNERVTPAKSVPGISGLVDCYRMYQKGLFGNKYYGDIYICEYSNENVWKAPKGYTLRE